MPETPGAAAPRLRPYLAYDDAPAAIEFLCKAFGFEERVRYAMPDGRIGHAELAYGDALLYLASTYEELGFQSPHKLPAVHSQVHLVVDDVDAHYAQAKKAGANSCRVGIYTDRRVEIAYRKQKPENIKEATRNYLSIEIFADEDVIRKQIMSMVTDTQRQQRSKAATVDDWRATGQVA